MKEEGNLTDYITQLTELYGKLRESGRDLYQLSHIDSWIVVLPDSAERKTKDGFYFKLNSEDLEIISRFFSDDTQDELKDFKLKPIKNLSDIKYFGISSLKKTIERGIMSIEDDFVQH
jgi:hypothetical protein